MCLDVLRVLLKQPGLGERLDAQFAEVKGINRHVDQQWRQLRLLLRQPDEARARYLVERLFSLATAEQVLRHLEPPLADAWCRQHLDPRGGAAIPDGVCQRLLLRASGVS